MRNAEGVQQGRHGGGASEQVQVTLWLPAALTQRLDTVARETRSTVSALLVHAVTLAYPNDAAPVPVPSPRQPRRLAPHDLTVHAHIQAQVHEALAPLHAQVALLLAQVQALMRSATSSAAPHGTEDEAHRRQASRPVREAPRRLGARRSHAPRRVVPADTATPPAYRVYRAHVADVRAAYARYTAQQRQVGRQVTPGGFATYLYTQTDLRTAPGGKVQSKTLQPLLTAPRTTRATRLRQG